MTTTSKSADLVAWSSNTALRLLRSQARRLEHAAAVGAKATLIGQSLPPREAQELEVAARLHDIGYAMALRTTGLHQIDGARWIASRGLPRIAALVAHHSEASVELDLRGRKSLLLQFHKPDQRLLDALTYCDMTTGPTGEPMSLEERIGEVGERRGRDSIVFTALSRARPRYELAIERTLALVQDQEKAAAGSSLK